MNNGLSVLHFCCSIYLQAVLGKSVKDVARPVVAGLRLALLSPSELTTLEEQNRKDQMIPVRDFTNVPNRYPAFESVCDFVYSCTV